MLAIMNSLILCFHSLASKKKMSFQEVKTDKQPEAREVAPKDV